MNKASGLIVRAYLLGFILLLYEGTCVVSLSLPIFWRDSEQEKSVEDNGNSGNVVVRSPLIMPVFARKAGGHWKPELVQGHGNHAHHQPSPVASEVRGKETERYEVDERDQSKDVSVNSEVIPTTTDLIKRIEVGHDGTDGEKGETEHWSEEHHFNIQKQNTEEEKEGDDGIGEEYEYEYDDWGNEEPEPECPENMFYHIRGKRCVPLNCPGGNQWRDQQTGECILKRYGYRNRGRYYRPWKPYRRTHYGGGRGSFAILLG